MKYSNTNWNLYRSFIIVYETKNFHRASEILGVTRAAVAQNIKELSKQLDTKLFNGHSKGVEPTSEAITLYPSIKSAASMIFNGEGNIQTFDETSRGIIKIATSSWASCLIAEYLIEFCKKYPNISLEFIKREKIDLLTHKDIDLCIEIKNKLNNPIFHVADLFCTKPIFIAKKNQLKKLPKNPSLNDFSTTPIIAQKDIFSLLPMEVKKVLKPSILTATTEHVLTMTQKDFGIGLYWDILTGITSDIIAIDIKEFDLPLIFSCACNKGSLTKSSKAFLDGLVEFCKRFNK